MENNLNTYIKNNDSTIRSLLGRRWQRMPFFFNSHIRNMYAIYKIENNARKRNDIAVKILNAYDQDILVKTAQQMLCLREDIYLFFKYHKGRLIMDCSDSHKKDYYSIAVILKNEARYIKEYILFYKATGADRVYIYDNDSTDNLTEVIGPYIASGFVIYRRWPGKKVQTAAYRDAVRRTKRSTKWLALVDSDEFLFPVSGDMKTLLSEYEDYPGVGVNWRLFGPNGHDKRPQGLVMDNYIECIADDEEIVNRHIKSIVQPAKVSFINRAHYAVYKGGKYAVDEKKTQIDNSCAFTPGAGKAFTGTPNGEIFRINHYLTRSMEDLSEKCERGFPDGTPKTNIESFKITFERPLKYDYSIKRFANIVREEII